MKKYIKYIIAVVLPLSMVSCLKDEELIGPDAKGSIGDIIEFGDLAKPTSGPTSSIPLYSVAFEMKPSGVLNLKLKSVGNGKASQDIKVVIALDNSLLDKYNEENDEEYVALPSSQYVLSTTEVTIKKGEREAIIPVELKPDQFTFDEDYALGFIIKNVSAGEVSGNFGKIILNISAKNPYDGVFNYKTSANTALAANVNKTVELVTVGPNRVNMPQGLVSIYSGNAVYYNIDPVTFAVTVECPSLGVQTPQDPRSKWDPEKKTLTVFWKQTGGGRTFEEVFTFIESR